MVCHSVSLGKSGLWGIFYRANGHRDRCRGICFFDWLTNHLSFHVDNVVARGLIS